MQLVNPYSVTARLYLLLLPLYSLERTNAEGSNSELASVRVGIESNRVGLSERN